MSISAGVFSTYPCFIAAAARQQLTQDDLLSFDAKGQVTLLHFTDIHGQLKPVYFRPPSENFGVADFEGRPPHLVGQISYAISRLSQDQRLLMLTPWLITRRWHGPMAVLAVLTAPQH